MLVKEIKHIGLVAIDTETNSLNLEKANLVGLSLSYSDKKGFYIPLNHKNTETKKNVKGQLNAAEVLGQIKLILQPLK